MSTFTKSYKVISEVKLKDLNRRIANLKILGWSLVEISKDIKGKHVAQLQR